MPNLIFLALIKLLSYQKCFDRFTRHERFRVLMGQFSLTGLFAHHKEFSDPLESQSYSWNIHIRYSKYHNKIIL